MRITGIKMHKKVALICSEKIFWTYKVIKLWMEPKLEIAYLLPHKCYVCLYSNIKQSLTCNIFDNSL